MVTDQEVTWCVADSAWIYVIEDAERAGQGLVTISVADLAEVLRELETRGIDAGQIEDVGDAGRKATVFDPERNSIALIQIAR